MPGNMQGQTTGRQQGLAERLIRSPKGDPLDPAAILATDKAAYVIPADDIGLEHPCGGKDETGPRIAGAERRQMFQRLDKFNIGAPGLQAPIDAQLGNDPFIAGMRRNSFSVMSLTRAR